MTRRSHQSAINGKCDSFVETLVTKGGTSEQEPPLQHVEAQALAHALRKPWVDFILPFDFGIKANHIEGGDWSQAAEAMRFTFIITTWKHLSEQYGNTLNAINQSKQNQYAVENEE